MEEQGLPTLEDLFDENFGDGQSDDLDGGPVSDATVSEDVTEQSDDSTDVPAKLSDLFNSEEEAQSDDEGQGEEAPDVLAQEVTLDDGSTATVAEIIRQRDEMRKDYTQKTQALADERREFESERESLEGARSLRDMLQENPMGTIAEMALRAGIIDEATAAQAARQSVKADDILPEKQEEEVDIDALVEAKVQEILSNTPAMEQYETQQAQAQVNEIFSDIEDTYDTQLDAADRNAVLQHALDLEEANLELVYLRLNAELQKQQRNTSRVRAAKPKSSVRNVQPTDADIVTEAPKTIEDAWLQAQVKVGA